MMIRSHVKTEPSKILGIDVQSWEGFLAGWGLGLRAEAWQGSQVVMDR